MIKLVIIADDLTGALDTGVQFSKKNISTIVTADLNFNTEEISKDADVIVSGTPLRQPGTFTVRDFVDCRIPVSGGAVRELVDSVLRYAGRSAGGYRCVAGCHLPWPDQ